MLIEQRKTNFCWAYWHLHINFLVFLIKTNPLWILNALFTFLWIYTRHSIIFFVMKGGWGRMTFEYLNFLGPISSTVDCKLCQDLVLKINTYRQVFPSKIKTTTWLWSSLCLAGIFNVWHRFILPFLESLFPQQKLHHGFEVRQLYCYERMCNPVLFLDKSLYIL